VKHETCTSVLNISSWKIWVFAWNCLPIWHSYVIGCTDDVLTFWQVFEELVRAQDNKAIWNKLLIYTNQVQDLMLLVFVDCTNDEVKCVRDEMKRFFTCGEGKNCRITSVYTRVMNKYVHPLLSVIPCLGIKGNPGYHKIQL
jgi:hypothetical protein